jgi:uncharacterized protein (DUF1015 family)
MTDDAPALVAPFCGVRFAAADRLSARIAPPYDVIGSEEREALAARDPDNVVRYILPEGAADRYGHARDVLDGWLTRGVLSEDPEPTVTVVRQEFTTPDGLSHARTGVIAAVAAEPFTAGRVRPHERTHSGPKEDRLALLRATAFMFEALLMFAPDSDGSVRAALTEAQRHAPLGTAEVGGTRVTLWRVGGPAATRIATAAGREPLYMADGHHRYETAVSYRAENAAATAVPALLVPLDDPGVVVLPTHRVVHGRTLDGPKLEAALRDRFQIKQLPAAANYVEELQAIGRRGTACVLVLPGARALALLLKGGRARLDDFATGLDPVVAALDVTRIDEFVVKQAVSAAGKEARLAYSAVADEVIEAVGRGEAAAGVLLNATAVSDVLAVADAGAVMPQKSTYFVPKVPSGLVGIRYGPA